MQENKIRTPVLTGYGGSRFWETRPNLKELEQEIKR